MRAVDAVMECLKAEGVDVVFGLPGGANLPTYDAFVDAGIRHVLVRHEAGGGHAAEGYAKATGKVGVAFGTSRPGRDEPRHADHGRDDGLGPRRCSSPARSAPTCSAPTASRRPTSIGITMPAVKHCFMIQHPLEIPRAIHEAFHIARTGRPGPVVVDIPVDLSRADIPYEPVTDVHLPGYQPTTEGNAKQIRQAAKALAAARRPVHLRGRRRRQRRGARSELDRAGHRRPLPGHLHADGARRLPGARTSSGSGCSACTARARRTTRWTRPTSSARSARASTTASPAS